MLASLLEVTMTEEYRIRIMPDTDAERPDNDPASGVYLTSRNRYFSVDEKLPESPRKWWAFPLYAYIHSGGRLSLTPFSCPWDSGQIGLVYVAKDTARMRKHAERIAQSHVAMWNQYLAGDVWGYQIEADGKLVDSCWGIYCRETAEKEVLEALRPMLENK
jgi:hypothetical protein